MEKTADLKNKIEQLAIGFRQCSKLFIAIGDETRQYLIVEMMKTGDCSGVRVGEITKRTNLSRPAVSHHLQILKAAGIVKVRKEGTKNFYYFDASDDVFKKVQTLLTTAEEILNELPERGTKD